MSGPSEDVFADAGGLEAETLRVRRKLDERMASSTDPERRVRLFGLGEALTMISGLGTTVDAMLERCRDAEAELPPMAGKISEYGRRRDALLALLLRAIDQDAPADAEIFDEIRGRSASLRDATDGMVEDLKDYADRFGIPLPDDEEDAPSFRH